MNADHHPETENRGGVRRRYADPYRFDRPETAVLRRLVSEWKDLQGVRIAFQQREADPKLVDALRKLEDGASRRLRKALEAHPIWPWLRDKKGLAGPSTALVLSVIGNPLRFPGQLCTEGHYLPVGVCEPGVPCPLVLAEACAEFEVRDGENTFPPAEVGAERAHDSGGGFSGAADRPAGSEARIGCPGVVLPARPGTGVRSVWHLLGLHAVEGVSPRKQRGFQCDWNPLARAAILAPDVGMAAQIVKHRTEPYRQRYDDAKARLTVERPDEPPFRLDHCARKIAVKAFIGDMFTTWKELTWN